MDIEKLEAKERNAAGWVGALILIFGAVGIITAINQNMNLGLFGVILVDNTFLYFEMACFLSIVFLLYPMRRGKTGKIEWCDWLLFFITLATSAYLSWNGSNISDFGWVYSAPLYPTIAAIILCLVALEAVRRAAGIVMLIVCLVFAVFPIFSHVLPGVLWSPQLDPLVVIREHALGTESILGQPIRVVTDVLMGFLIFGAALVVTGGGAVFMELAMALLGHTRGGTAKVAVLSSALFGSLSGSVLSNVVTTGKLTIPAMRRAGYPPTYAAAVEACASTGGTLMPPVMGAVAFIMADFLRISYVDVAIAAALPSALYYLALILQVDLFAARMDIKGSATDELPRLRDVLLRGWHHIGGLLLLTYLLMWTRNETYAPYIATGFVVVISLIRRQINVYGLINLLRESTSTIVNIFAILAGVGMVIGSLTFTGVGAAFARELLLIGGQNIYLLLLLGALTSFILGMGMTITACYLLLATILPTALVQQGLDPTAVHLFILYWGMLSFITPPVALGSMAAASIAGVDPMQAGFKSMRIGTILFILPFMFVMNPELILKGSFSECAVAGFTAIASVFLISFALEGWIYKIGRINSFSRIALGASGLLVMHPGFETDLYGSALAILVIVFNLVRKKIPVRNREF